MLDDLGIGSQGEAFKKNFAPLSHRRLGRRDGGVDVIGGGFNEQGFVDGAAEPDPRSVVRQHASCSMSAPVPSWHFASGKTTRPHDFSQGLEEWRRGESNPGPVVPRYKRLRAYSAFFISPPGYPTDRGRAAIQEWCLAVASPGTGNDEPDLMTARGSSQTKDPVAGQPKLGSQRELRFGSYHLIDFLRGQSINHSTQPIPRVTRSIPNRPLTCFIIPRWPLLDNPPRHPVHFNLLSV